MRFLFFSSKASGLLLMACLLFIFNSPHLYAQNTQETEAANATTAAAFEQAQNLLKEKSFKKKAQAVELIVQSQDPRAKVWLQALLEGRLYYHKQKGYLAFIKDKSISQAEDEQALPDAKRKDFKKITTNNKLRKTLRFKIAHLNLSNPDHTIRLAAVNALLNQPDENSSSLLKSLLDKENDPQIREAMQLGVDIAELNAEDTDTQLKAIQAVSGQLHPKIRKQLLKLSNDADPVIAKAAQTVLQEIDEKLIFYKRIETLFFGISLGSVLVLAAIGLAITFGVMGVINMAHGELIMLGAYTTYFVQQLLPGAINYSLFIAIPAAFMVSGAVGILIERTVIRHLYGRPLETLLATFGISLILQQLVRTLVSPQNVPVSNPDWMSGLWQVNSVLSLTLNRLYIIVFCLLVFAALFLVMRKTALGLQVRAVSQNRAMARAMGVHSARVDALTFGLGAGIAGVAGVALSQLTNVGPNLGQAYIIDSFMVVVFGGVGNLWGTLVAGMSLGILNKFLEPWAGAVLAKILLLVFIILFIQKRPRGLFPQKGRAAAE